ncbi:hypothetical protein AVEN_96644-1 [Araneus ventricosus]|uniref:Uncharacterized protein n=1 Tax=Araneus ventricosus TaxID=182803 RepID=A0A4Y2E9M9_ARAVE|nr:hypothetical protein AVEN_96644-1 [Araneus ventricosus]
MSGIGTDDYFVIRRLPVSHIVPLLGWEDTFVIEKVNSKQFRRTIKEEHYSILQEPGSVFDGHVAPSFGSAQNIANSILFYLNETLYLLHELDVSRCDGTVTNTGK